MKAVQEYLKNYKNTIRGLVALIIGILLLISAFYVPFLSGLLLTEADGTIGRNTIIMASIGCIFFFGGIQQLTISLRNYAKNKLEE